MYLGDGFAGQIVGAAPPCSCTCCYTEIEVADQACYLTQSWFADTGPTSSSADPTTPGYLATGISTSESVVCRPVKAPRGKRGSTPDMALSARALYHQATWEGTCPPVFARTDHSINLDNTTKHVFCYLQHDSAVQKDLVVCTCMINRAMLLVGCLLA